MINRNCHSLKIKKIFRDVNCNQGEHKYEKKNIKIKSLLAVLLLLFM